MPQQLARLLRLDIGMKRRILLKNDAPIKMILKTESYIERELLISWM